MTIAPFYMELTEEQKKLAEWWTKNVFQRPMPKKRRRRKKKKEKPVSEEFQKWMEEMEKELAKEQEQTQDSKSSTQTNDKMI